MDDSFFNQNAFNELLIVQRVYFHKQYLCNKIIFLYLIDLQ